MNAEILDNREEVVVVKGLGRHLELQELKKKQNEEKKLREAEVFGINHKFAINAAEYDITNPQRHCLIPGSMNNSLMNSNANMGTTVPQPFNLSQNQQFGIIRKNKEQRELKEKERDQCTFQPKTNGPYRSQSHNFVDEDDNQNE